MEEYMSYGSLEIEILNTFWSFAAVDEDVDISIHFNAANHQKMRDKKNVGTEVWVRNTDGVRGDLAKRICNKISKIGFTNRMQR